VFAFIIKELKIEIVNKNLKKVNKKLFEFLIKFNIKLKLIFKNL
jgi:hypothetical protein